VQGASDRYILLSWEEEPNNNQHLLIMVDNILHLPDTPSVALPGIWNSGSTASDRFVWRVSYHIHIYLDKSIPPCLNNQLMFALITLVSPCKEGQPTKREVLYLDTVATQGGTGN
jgi:hypothetical protein